MVHARRPAVRPAEYSDQFAKCQLRRNYRQHNRTCRVEARPGLPSPIPAKAPARSGSDSGAAQPPLDCPGVTPDTELLEYVCNENERDLKHMVGADK